MAPVDAQDCDFVRLRASERSFGYTVVYFCFDEGADVPDANVAVIIAGSGSEREFAQRLGRILRPKDDGSRALRYELVSENPTEERVTERRR